MEDKEIEEGYNLLSIQQKWLKELSAAEEELKDWHERGDKVLQIYLEDRPTGTHNKRQFNLFTANVGIVMGALFGRIPKPDVNRRFKDATDQVGRVASTILERAIFTELDTEGYFSETAKNILRDRLVPGAGAAWVRYVPTYGEQSIHITANSDEELAEVETSSPIILDERTPIEHVVWKDLLWSPCRTWNECRWIARRVHLDHEEIEERFGEETAKRIAEGQAQHDAVKTGTKIEVRNRVIDTVEVWEIWCKTSKKVYFITEFSDRALDVKDDPFGLPGFFPTAKPLVGIVGTQSFIPTPDYVFVQDQYEELNVLNSRISNLIKACKVAGAYDKANTAIGQIFSPTTPETILVPVDRWDAFAEKGGIKGAIDFIPIDQIARVIEQLNKAREIIKEQIYELTGISDIIRGQSNQYETLGAQNIKAQYAGLRLQSMQLEFAEFMSELIRVKAFLMAKFYDPQTLLRKAGPLMPQDQQFIGPAIQLIKDELLSNTSIEVSVDALQAQNDIQDKQDRAEVVNSITGLLREGVPAAQQVPEIGPLVMHLIKFAVSAFKGGREIEGMIDEELQKLLGQDPQQPKPTPQEMQQQAQAQQAQAQAQAQQAEMQFKMQLEQMKLEADMTIAREKMQLEMEFKREQLALEAEKLKLEAAKLQQQGQIEAAKLQVKQAPSVVLGNNGMDEDGIAQAIATIQQSTLQAIAQMQQSTIGALQELANQPEEPAIISVSRNPDGSLTGTIQ